MFLVTFKIKPLNITTHQPVFPGPVGGGHPNFAIGAGERSFHSLRPSSATGKQRDNLCYLSIFQACSMFCRLLISESGRKSATSQICELRRQTDTAKKHLFQRLRTQFFRDFAVFVARFGNERSQTLGLKKQKQSKNATEAD